MATNKDFPKGERIYALIKKLFKHRNMLVHHKGKEIKFEIGLANEDYLETMNKNIDFIFDEIDELVKSYPMFLKTISSLENKDIDLYTEQNIELTSQLFSTIQDTIIKVLNPNNKHE